MSLRGKVQNKPAAWVEPDDKGFVPMGMMETDMKISDWLQDQRIQKGVSRRILTAATRAQVEEAGDDDFGFGVFSDWRGRKYYHACGLSPQGKDTAKGLLMAAEPKRLGKAGLHHLAVGVATNWGNGQEKLALKERAAWTDAQVASGWLRKTVEGAQAQTDFTWRLADEPMQFLAAAVDYLKADGDENFESAVMVGYDATCSGLQVLAAMMRCETTASKVNVLPRADGKRADIYMEVADLLKQRCGEIAAELETADVLERIKIGTAEGADWSVFWLDHGITRSVTKKPVMVFCYGGKVRTFASSIRDETRAPWKACMWLAKLIYDDVLRGLVPGALEFMEWIQDVAKILAAAGKPLAFVTDNGLPFSQEVMETEESSVRARLSMGEVMLRTHKKTSTFNTNGMTTAAAPNTTHCGDSAAVEGAAITFKENGIDYFAMVHDCFYLRAGDWECGWTLLREVFRDTFSGDPVDALWKKLQASSGVDLPAPPKRGCLDLSKVMGSEFLFS